MKAHLKNPADFKISACTIAKNESKTIAKSINSYKKYVDEIIVVDTGSTDDTVKIAQELGAKVLHFEWCNDFAAAKNVALDAATGDWIIFLDADEYFADDTCDNVKAVILNAILEKKNAIGCRMENIEMNTGERSGDGFSIRVFKAGIRYRYPIHEEIYNPDSLDVLSVDKSYFYLKHTGYSSNISVQKCERNLDILLDEIKSEKDEGRVTVCCSYISDSYYGMGKFKEAREYAEKFIEQSEGSNIKIVGCEIKPYMNIILSLETEKANPELIDRYIKMFEDKYPDCPDAAYADARNCMRKHLYSRAIKKIDEAVKLSENFNGTYMDSVGAQKANVFVSRGMCEEALLHTSSAMDWYFKGYKEESNYQTALFNLLRVVHEMPQQKLDSFTEALYKGVVNERHICVLSALMCNYMVPQLMKCYAAYRMDNKSDALDVGVTAFIMAGEAKYESAANLFFLNYKSDGRKDTAMRCLLCAVLSDNKELIAQALTICRPAYGLALGLSEKNELTTDDISDIAAIYIECSRIGQIDYMIAKISAVAPKLDDTELLRLSSFLIDGFAFEAALNVARQLSISAESVFTQGYCLYRMHRLNEAVELMLLAKHMGYDKPVFDETDANIAAIHVAAIREKSIEELSDDKKAQLKSQIEHKIEAGDLGGAGKDIEAYMRVTEPDSDTFATQATLFYYSGEYKRAAIAAECGILKDDNNFDLLYNAGCIYQKLGNTDRAKAAFLAAIENCDDPDLVNEISQTLGAINANSGK